MPEDSCGEYTAVFKAMAKINQCFKGKQRGGKIVFFWKKTYKDLLAKPTNMLDTPILTPISGP